MPHATFHGLGLRVFVVHLPLTRGTQRPRHRALRRLRLNHRLGGLFTQLLRILNTAFSICVKLGRGV